MEFTYPIRKWTNSSRYRRWLRKRRMGQSEGGSRRGRWSLAGDLQNNYERDTWMYNMILFSVHTSLCWVESQQRSWKVYLCLSGERVAVRLRDQVLFSELCRCEDGMWCSY